VTVFDARREWTVDPNKFVSKGRNSPYSGHTLVGVVMCTIVGGRIVHQAAG
jgi:dihydroorotase